MNTTPNRADADDNTRMQCYWHALSRKQRIDIYLELFNCDLRTALWGYNGPVEQHHNPRAVD